MTSHSGQTHVIPLIPRPLPFGGIAGSTTGRTVFAHTGHFAMFYRVGSCLSYDSGVGIRISLPHWSRARTPFGNSYIILLAEPHIKHALSYFYPLLLGLEYDQYL